MVTNKTLAGIAVGATLLVGGGTVDLVPVSLPAEAWGQYRVADYVDYTPGWTEITATGTIVHDPIQQPTFSDDDGDGVVSYAIAFNKKGEKVYTQISEDGYKKLGMKDGAKYNLDYQAVDYVPLAEAIIEGLAPKTAEAAIAYDSGNKYTACGGNNLSSCTYSFTNTAGSIVMANTSDFGNPPVNPGATTMTYGGDSMTSMSGGTAQFVTGNGGAYSETFYLATTKTGANNLVITTTNNMPNGFYVHALSYSGAGSVQNITLQSTGLVTNDTCSVTVTDTTNSWAVWLGLTGVAGRTYSAGANTTARTAAGDGQTYVYDSNGIVASSPRVFNATISVGDSYNIDTCFELVMASAAPINTTNNGCHGELHGQWYCQQ